jgi:putative salt-induced outer membrane protein YdiY
VPPPPKWESSVAVGFTLTRGNSETELFTANAQTQKKWPKHELAFGADAAYGKNEDTKTAASVHGFGQYNYLFTERWYAMLRVDALHDDIADIAYRVTISPGVGYYFIKEKMTYLAGEVGPAVVIERQGDESRTYATLRLAERFEHKFENKARIWQTLEFLPQVDRWGNYLINAEIGVDAPLSKKLFLTVYAVDNYDNEPAPGRKCNDIKLVSGLKYTF